MTLNRRSNGSLKTSHMLPGVHRVKKRLANGLIAEYWYVFRGGPCILRAVASDPSGLSAEVARQAVDAAIEYRKHITPRSDRRLLYGLVGRFLESAEFGSLSPRTKADYRRALDVVRTDLGQLEIAALDAKGIRSFLIDWRDGYKSHPKTADARLGVLARVLQWAYERGELVRNPLANWPRIYRCMRADVIWRPEDLALILPQISTDAGRSAVLFAAYSGLRVGDLPKLTWSAIGESAIVWQTGKSSGRRTVIIPITDELRAVIDGLPRSDVTGALTVLTNSNGKPWTVSGIQTTLQKAKQAVALQFPKGESPIAHLRVHDLRGTAATNFIRNNATLEDAATILGWAKHRVEAIASRYVTSEAIALAIVERMRRNKP